MSLAAGLFFHEFLFHSAGQGKIEIVAAEQKVLADGSSLKLQLAVDQVSPYQTKVRRPTADVADQNQFTIAEISIVPFRIGDGCEGRPPAGACRFAAIHA